MFYYKHFFTGSLKVCLYYSFDLSKCRLGHVKSLFIFAFVAWESVYKPYRRANLEWKFVRLIRMTFGWQVVLFDFKTVLNLGINFHLFHLNGDSKYTNIIPIRTYGFLSGLIRNSVAFLPF